VSINPLTETLITLAQAAALPWIPRRRGRSGRLHVSTMWRWALKGIRGIKLEVVKVGGTLCTSAEALQRFFDRLANGNAVDDAPRPIPVAANQDDVERQLDELGVRLPARGRLRQTRSSSETR
jgi:hypothetical protein